MAPQGTLPSAGAGIDAAPVTDTFNHIMDTYNGGNIEAENVDPTEIALLATTQAFTGDKTFSGLAAFTGTHSGLPFFVDAVVAGSGADYSTIQAADNALDAAAGYRLRVAGSQTYAETVTVSTNYNVWYVDSLTVITSLVLSGQGNTVILGASCQFTGDITLSGNHNKVVFGQDANLDGHITLSGTANELHCGAGANLATSKTLLLSGANSKAIIGAQFACPGIISMTADDTYLEIGNQSVITGAQTLATGSGQVMKFGNDCQLVGNTELQSADNELHMGSTANIDGTVAMTGSNAKMTVGDNSSLAQTLTFAVGTNQKFIAGDSVQVVGNIAMAGLDSWMEFGSDANLDGTVAITSSRQTFKVGGQSNLAQTVTMGAGAGSMFYCGPVTQIVGNITISGASMLFEAGAQWNFDGIIDITSGGDKCKMTLGMSGSLAGAFTCSGAETEMHLGANCQIVGNILIDGIRSIWRQGSIADINGTVLLTGAGTEMHLGMAADLAQTLGITTGTGGQSFSCGSNSTITGIITMSSVSSRLRIGNDSGVVAAVNLTGVDGYIYAEQKVDFGGIVTLSGAGCSLICENGCDFDGIVVSGAKCFVDGGGHDTLVNGTTANHAISLVGADDVTIQHIALQTTSTGGQAYDGLATDASSGYTTVHDVLFVESDNRAAGMTGDFAKFSFCEFRGVADIGFIMFGGDRGRVLGCHFGGGNGGNMINTTADADKTLIVGNHGEDPNSSFNLVSGADYSLVASNIVNLASANASANSAVADEIVY
tara:strand:+ start:40 stop:2352 length:2313 start_codon:yes stop_codon:yes gene_type:complete